MFKFLSQKETLILAFISAISYSCAYLYEYTYAKYFNYPKEIITVSLFSLIKMGLSIFCLFFFFLGIFYVLDKLAKSLGRYGKKLHSNHIFIMLYSFMVVFLYLAGIPYFIYYFIFTITLIIYLIIYSIFKKNEEIDNENYYSILIRNIETQSISLISIILITLYLLVLAIGTYNARTTLNFYYFNKENKDYIIVNKYDDIIITKEINKNKTTKDSIYIFNSNDINNIEIKMIKINTN
ncbi:hypothetical protein [Proteus mirabilis]|uniref:hypothetical protein n=1 Tax=Proteus mirabilis TaxID=584 RepID=UPI0034E3A9D3